MSSEEVSEVLLAPNKLRWACRRGMLELDIFFGNFVEREYDNLTFSEKLIFQELLEEADQILFDYFLGQRKPSDSETERVIEKIRRSAAN